MNHAHEVGITFGTLLKSYRTQKKLTQLGLAERVHVSHISISYYECGRRLPRLGKAIEIAKALELNEDSKDKLLSFLNLPIEGAPNVSTLLDELSQEFYDPKTPTHLKENLAAQVNGVLKDWKEMLRNEVKWAVIPVAGWQSRLLDIKPTVKVIHHAIAESRMCGLDRIILVIAPSQEESLSTQLKKEKKIYLAVQETQLGLGHAVMSALRYLQSNQSFALILPDERMDESCLSTMVKLYNKHKCTIVSARKFKKADEENYGVLRWMERKGDTCTIQALQEKPEVRQPGQTLAILGRYILTPSIFKQLEAITPDPRTGHIELTDALNRLAHTQKVLGYIYGGKVQSISPSRRQLINQLEEFLK